MSSSIAVLGTGYVGLVTGTCLADLGNRVVCVDKDLRKVEGLRAGRVPIYEPGLSDLIQRNRAAGRLSFTHDTAKAVKDAEIIFIAVGTPPLKNGDVDIRQVTEVARTIGKNLNGPKIVVNKSTVPIGMGNLVAEIVASEASPEQSFDVVSNPEFLREGNAVEDLFHPDRIVIGADRREAALKVAELYRDLDGPVVITDLKSAEMIKYASNAFLATRISFINEIANLCENLGADVAQVARGMGLDKRIGPHFLRAGLGYGGSCFPKDTKGLRGLARKAGYRFRLLEATEAVNDAQMDRFFAKLQHEVRPLRGARVALWGLTFKANTDDVRESPALDLAGRLLKAGARLKAYDPVGGAPARRTLARLNVASSPYAAAEGARALVVATEWNEFKQINLKRLRKAMAVPLILDGRNLYNPDALRKAGFRHVSVGRAPVGMAEARR